MTFPYHSKYSSRYFFYGLVNNFCLCNYIANFYFYKVGQLHTLSNYCAVIMVVDSYLHLSQQRADMLVPISVTSQHLNLPIYLGAIFIDCHENAVGN
jgi:hypothetical protein